MKSVWIHSGSSPFSRSLLLEKSHWDFFHWKCLNSSESLDTTARQVKGSFKMTLALGSLFDVWWSTELCSLAFIYFARNFPLYEYCWFVGVAIRQTLVAAMSWGCTFSLQCTHTTYNSPSKYKILERYKSCFHSSSIFLRPDAYCYLHCTYKSIHSWKAGLKALLLAGFPLNELATVFRKKK